MYMIIDNLNRKIKRSQNKFSIIIMNLILIIKIDDDHKLFVRHEVYHRMRKFIFKHV